MTYAATTKVPVDQTRAEIERTLTRYGAARFAYMGEAGRAVLIFEIANRRVKFDMPFAEGEDQKAAQLRRSKWRSLLLCIKAKLESVESEIETFEEAFLAHVVMPDGKTVGEHALPMIAESYESKQMRPLLPAPRKSA